MIVTVEAYKWSSDGGQMLPSAWAMRSPVYPASEQLYMTTVSLDWENAESTWEEWVVHEEDGS